MGKCEQCIVREFSALKALNKDQLLQLADCKTSFVVKKGDVIFGEGDHLDGIFCVKEGVCKLTKLSSNGKDQIIKLVSRGELLGQRSLISEEPTNLSAVALEDMTVCFVPKNQIMDFFNKNNKFSLNVMKNVCNDLKEADNSLVNQAQKSVKERLAFTLLYLHDTFGVNEDQSLKVHLTREEISSIIGTATESCIRLLSDFNKSGLIEIVGKKIILKNTKGLRKLSE